MMGNCPTVNSEVGYYPLASLMPCGQKPTAMGKRRRDPQRDPDWLKRLLAVIEEDTRGAAPISVAAGRGKTYVRDLKEGRTLIPSVENARQLAEAVGIDFPLLFNPRWDEIFPIWKRLTTDQRAAISLRTVREMQWALEKRGITDE
jgi:transcriptional regulator with XRE-family HTH domain